MTTTQHPTPASARDTPTPERTDGPGAGFRGDLVGPEVAHVVARAGGPVRLGAGGAAPPGMARLGFGDGSGVGVPVWPDGATPSLLEEHQIAPMPVERAGEARRVLAACLKCCWTDLAADPWPGSPASLEFVLDTYRALIGRSDDLMRNWAVGALRRLHDSAWVVLSDGVVRLGPRVALWPVESFAQLKELVRRIPEPERDELTVVEEALAPLEGQAAQGAAEFDDLLTTYDERRRAELVAAYMAIEHAAEPVQEAKLAALRDPALRHTLSAMLGRRGRVLIQHRDRWTSGYDDHAAAEANRAAQEQATQEQAAQAVQTQGGNAQHGLGESERAVLTLILVHSVAIPRAEGSLPEDTWMSPHPTPVDELRRHTQLPVGEIEAALRVLRHAGLVGQVKAGEEAGGYVPGPQFHRLTPGARRRLQEELILAAGPHTPLAAAVRAKRSA
ncbi:hypothetical protein OIE66_11720 [Nonomuraea sp. NBC_01738]|uniref:hypothetical protein n=1 Tax=Nonomuraea sp. NBC_01738 TaxID=2976003 RepID=UPI002E131B73|nr:hypothetical protein OIE66_11720 [Nonomuraea sp. NBC_01738]